MNEKMNDNLKSLYRFTSNNFNNMLQYRNGIPFEIYKKYLYKGIDKLRPYDSDFCDTLDKMVKIMETRRNRFLLLLMISLVFPQISLLKLRKIAF